MTQSVLLAVTELLANSDLAPHQLDQAVAELFYRACAETNLTAVKLLVVSGYLPLIWYDLPQNTA